MKSEAFLFLAAGLLSGLFIAFLLLFFVRKRLRGKLLPILKALDRYAAGQFSEKIEASSHDLQGLIRALNRMAANTHRKIESLEREKTKLTSVLDNLSEAVVAINARKEVVMLNPSAESLLGAPRVKAVGKSLIQLVRDPTLDEMMDRAMQTQGAESREVELSLGKKRSVSANAVGISRSREGVAGLLVLSDVTRLKRLEKLCKEFVANVSHELKTPLTSIKGFVETLQEGAVESPEKAKRFLGLIQEDTGRLTRLVEDLLELSKIESRELRLKLEPLDLKEECEKVMANFRPALTQKGVQAHLLAPSSPRVLADRDSLRQVLVNLMDNAIKFNRPGGEIFIEVRTSEERVTVSIRDTGIGIAIEDQTRVFERFFRVDNARSRESGGTGLGLSIVKHIIEAHGGEVSCQSSPGRGSTFTFTLSHATPHTANLYSQFTPS